MQTSWWRERKELDDAQQALVMLPPDGNHLFVGPPGCGKTNMLVLRAKYLSGSGDSNILFLTYGRTLAEFIKTGVASSKQHIEPEQVMTFRMWSIMTLAELAPAAMSAKPGGEYDEVRNWFATELESATRGLPGDYYDAIFVDEVQDLKSEELRILARLTPRLNVAGDGRQTIYEGNGLDAAKELGLQRSLLEYHYRIGPAICRVADRVLADDGAKPLTQTCRYDDKKTKSSAEAVSCDSFDAQLQEMVENIRLQRKAFQDDSIGIFLPTFKGGLLARLQEYLNATELAPLVGYHTEDEKEFEDGKRIFVMTCHASKGTEFRAVHILAGEKLRWPLGRRRLVFTAVTRAKTSLRLYYTGTLTAFVKAAFAKPTAVDLDSLF
ncbi:ATP-binding domain-containing protein [Ralstonia solanacearum]|nr:ATP-binding domain-containing protein [Ralstonia solanacearum]QKM31280.1 ATP-binding domain-containing protein [Ralstonia solanacearum]QKM36260.1 ATP-binding domain-containing protein [Ralstonia solanacearum]